LGKVEYGEGIPKYNREQLMTKEEIHGFGIETVVRCLRGEEYEILNVKTEIGIHPSIICKKDGGLYIIEVASDIAPKNGQVPDMLRKQLKEHAIGMNAVPCVASVGFGACDSDRFNASLALRGDGFYANFTGLEFLDGRLSELAEELEITQDMTVLNEVEPHRRAILILKHCYATADSSLIEEYLADDVVCESQWVIQPREGKAVVMAYYNEKATRMKESADHVRVQEARLVKKGKGGQVMLSYKEGDPVLVMVQGENTCIVTVKMNESQLISRIDICMPQFFQWELV